jgi:PAS domain S-box-containing protein
LEELASANEDLRIQAEESQAQAIELMAQAEELEIQREREIQRLASFPQLNPNPILEVDTSGRITYSNQAAREVVTGLGPPAKLRDLLPADLKQILLNIKRTGKTHFQREVQVKDTVYLQSISCAEPFQAIRLYGIDISKRKRSEAAVLKANEEWERTFEAVPDLIALLDTNHHFVRVNRAMAAALGAEPQELAGKPCYELMHRSTRPPDVCPHSLLLQDGQGHTAEIREFDRDFLVTTSPLVDDKGQLMGSVHVARDITKRKRAEEALSRLNEELEQRVAARTEELHESVAQLKEEINEREEAEQKAAVLGRLYRLLSRVYESIVHAQDQEELFRQACRIMMEEGDFLHCWSGRVDWSGRRHNTTSLTIIRKILLFPWKMSRRAGDRPG